MRAVLASKGEFYTDGDLAKILAGTTEEEFCSTWLKSYKSIKNWGYVEEILEMWKVIMNRR